jgi:hypothetical protein
MSGLTLPRTDKYVNAPVSVKVTSVFTSISLASLSLIFTFQVLQSVINDLDLLLDYRQALREVIVLRDTVFKLLQAVVRKLRADEDTTK